MAIQINGNGTITGISSGGLPAGTVTSATLAAGTVSSGLPSGSVIQTKFVNDTSSSATLQQSTSGAWEDLGSLSVNITPSAASSKILVLAHTCLSEQTTDYGIWFRILRGSTPLVGATSGSRTAISFGNSNSGSYFDDKLVSSDFSYVDAPATTSAVTYKVQAVNRYSPHQWAYNRSHDGANNASQGQGVSTLTLMEIKG